MLNYTSPFCGPFLRKVCDHLVNKQRSALTPLRPLLPNLVLCPSPFLSLLAIGTCGLHHLSHRYFVLPDEVTRTNPGQQVPEVEIPGLRIKLGMRERRLLKVKIQVQGVVN